MEHFDTICNSPSQIYKSALPLSPSSSWLCKNYATELSQVPKIIRGATAEWGACSRTVLLGTSTLALSYWNNVIAVGSRGGDIITLDAITGSRMAVLSGHIYEVNCVTFSCDGRSLASGADDNSIKLWDVQTGGVVRTFLGHTERVWSVSTSADHTRIVSGSEDRAICLWDTQTGECLYTIKQQDSVRYVGFSPIDPQHIISTSGDKVWEWDLNGQQIPPTYNGTHIAFSPDCTKFALCSKDAVTVQNSNSKEIETLLPLTSGSAQCCCFTPDNRLITVAVDDTAYVWDIATSDSHLVGTLVGHTSKITSLVFSSPSSLISVSSDKSIRFWQIDVLSTGPVITNSESTALLSSTIQSVSLQTSSGLAISSDREGVVKAWDLLTGLCKASFQTPAGDCPWRDARLINGGLIVIWWKGNQIYVWRTNMDDPPRVVTRLSSPLKGLRISGDGSKFFTLIEGSIQAWSIHTGEPAGEVKLKLEKSFYLDPLWVGGSKIWIQLKDVSIQGWNFGISNSLPIPLFDGLPERPLLEFIGGAQWQTKDPSWIRNRVTGKEVFQLSGRYAEPGEIQWDGQYLVAGYESGEVLIMDFHYPCTE